MSDPFHNDGSGGKREKEGGGATPNFLLHPIAYFSTTDSFPEKKSFFFLSLSLSGMIGNDGRRRATLSFKKRRFFA